MKNREKHWKQRWEQRNICKSSMDGGKKRYVLAMFPYPSGNLHMGHVRNYTLADAYARYSRQRGYSVLHPMGWDSFGLPAENAAIKRDTDPDKWISKCISDMREEMKNLGLSYDWEREFRTSDPDVYRWTQWLFTEMFENGLVERKEAELNWCSGCETVLADSQVEGEDNECWRCGTEVVEKKKEQWFFKITEYADELLEDLDRLDEWPDQVVEQQKNWIEGDSDTEGYHLNDWLISRQRYWGTPIPLVDCDSCGYVSVDEDDLPVELPEDFDSESGNPLDSSDDFKKVECPNCGDESERVTDTMDTFVDSSWYFLQFASQADDQNPMESQRASLWTPVDKYIGGVEHATTHLLYARFIMHVLKDLGHVSNDEPFHSLITQGMVLLDGEKMSKSKGNVVRPSRILDEYGADTARWFICDAAAPKYDFDWKEDEVDSADEFVDSLVSNFALGDESKGTGELDEFVRAHCSRVLKECSKHYENLDYHLATTRIREFESYVRPHYGSDLTSIETDRKIRKTIARVSYPIIPHAAEEITRDFARTYQWDSIDHDLNVDYIQSVEEDIISILNNLDEEDPYSIQISCGPEWTYEIYRAIQNREIGSVSELMENEKYREKGNKAAETYRKLKENEVYFNTRKQEIKNIKSMKPHIKSKFGLECKIVEGNDAGIPGRPYINIRV